jgi:hypothetical protein
MAPAESDQYSIVERLDTQRHPGEAERPPPCGAARVHILGIHLERDLRIVTQTEPGSYRIEDQTQLSRRGR